jgi:hypothetical protein
MTGPEFLSISRKSAGLAKVTLGFAKRICVFKGAWSFPAGKLQALGKTPPEVHRAAG